MAVVGLSGAGAGWVRNSAPREEANHAIAPANPRRGSVRADERRGGRPAVQPIRSREYAGASWVRSRLSRGAIPVLRSTGMAAEPGLAPGSIIGAVYKIRRLIGQGGMGEV